MKVFNILVGGRWFAKTVPCELRMKMPTVKGREESGNDVLAWRCLKQ